MAFLLRPDVPPEGRAREPRPGETDTELSEPLKSYAAEAGLVMKPPTITPNTIKALEATEYAKEHGDALAFHTALYRAYWERSHNLGDESVLKQAAVECMMDWPAMKAALDKQSYRDAVLTQFQTARVLGIRAIPAFLVGDIRLIGAQPYGIFQQAAQHTLSTLATDPNAFSGGPLGGP